MTKTEGDRAIEPRPTRGAGARPPQHRIMRDESNGMPSSAPNTSTLMKPPGRTPGVVALVSGGLDSAVMAGLAVDRGDRVLPLYVRQGFVWEDEEETAVRRFLEALGAYAPQARASGRLMDLRVSALSAPQRFAGAWALDAARPAPAADSPDEAVYLPGRNLALLTQAALAAYSHGMERIQIGALSGNPFPDATPAFFRAFEHCVAEAMRWPLRVEAPLSRLTKTETLELGLRYPLARTLSCIRPVRGTHCGRCNKCEERHVAFVRAALPDPTTYLQPGR